MQLTTIIAVSDDKRMQWEVSILLESLIEHNFKYETRILVFKPKDRIEWNNWREIEERYPKVRFFYYEDDGSVLPLLRTYHTIHRAYSLKKHWEQFPELKDHAILYLDSDIILTKELDLDDLLQDDNCYGADIRSYNNWSYFTNKISRVRPEKLEEYQRGNPLKQIWNELGIEEEELKKRDDNCAGVHYLLKNITIDVWEDVLYKSVPLIKNLERLNQYYIEGSTPTERKNNGWQSFCADIWLLLICIYKKGGNTIPSEKLQFTWSTDQKDKLETTYWLHNCSIGSENHFDGNPSFYKGASRYVNNTATPLDHSEQPYIDSILDNPISQKYANHTYTEKIKQLYNKLNNYDKA